MTNDSAREARARQMAEQAGLTVVKSRDPEADDYGTFGLVLVTGDSTDWRGRQLVAGDPHHGHGLTLEEIEQMVSDPVQTRTLLGIEN